MISNEKRLLDIVENSKIIIFGAGMCAKVAVRYIIRNNRGDSISCIAVTDKKNNPDVLMGIPVVNIGDIEQELQSNLVIIATLQESHDKIRDILVKAGFSSIDEIADECFCQMKQLLLDYYRFAVGLVGIGYQDNFGGILTNFALYKYLEFIGMQPLMIDMPRDMGTTYMFSDYQYGNTTARRFMNKYLNVSKVYDGKYDIKEVNNNCEVFIVGSDQIWCHAVYCPADYFVFLDFIQDNKKKIAYASSFGHDIWHGSERERERASFFLSKFDGISVREDSGADILEKVFGVDATHVLDPVFICPSMFYDRLIANSCAVKHCDYIFTYIIDPDCDRRDAIMYVSDKLAIQAINFVEPRYAKCFAETLGLENTFENAEVEDFLFYIKYSEFVLTDSYHGVCFAILFRKSFICIGNERRGLTRFMSLLDMLGLTDRMVADAKEISGKNSLFEEIDYDEVYKIIDENRKFSAGWLNSHIFAENDKKISAYDILDERCDELKRELTESIERQKWLTAELEEIKRTIKECVVESDI